MNAGAAGAETIFTSIFDDSVGGDSGNDGPTTGQTGDYYQSVYDKGGQITIANAVFRHGYDALEADCPIGYGESVTITDSSFYAPFRSPGCISEVVLERNHFEVSLAWAGSN